VPEVGRWMADGPYRVTEVSQTSNAGHIDSVAVRLRGISSVVERVTAQSIG
jgi:hypothetical protein